MSEKRRFASGWTAGLLLVAAGLLLAAGPLTGALAAPMSQTYPVGVVINEFMPNPASDWDGSGQFSESGDEYIELYNNAAFAIDISGWKLDDAASLETSPYILPPNTILQPGQYGVFFGSQTGVGLNNTNDSARLLYPDDQVADEYIYPNTADDVPYSRAGDGTGDWTTSYPPSPGASNQPAPTPTSTPTPTPAVYPDGIVLNEFMPNPLADWNGDGTTGDDNDEYIELYNLNDAAVDLTGWLVDDADGGSTPYRLPAGSSIAAHGFLTLWSRDTHLSLNNSGGDAARLLTPDGIVRDAH
ncbi:MAG: lamin tail domain-containing protein, partial [Anaerolineae bacterium]